MAGFARVSRHSRLLVVIPGNDRESRKSWIPDHVGDDRGSHGSPVKPGTTSNGTLNQNNQDKRYDLNSNKPNKHVA
jgi:hypothetical protein